MELVGAPLAFIRGPFVAEGFLQGGHWGTPRHCRSVGRVPDCDGLVGDRPQQPVGWGIRAIPADSALFVLDSRWDAGRQCGRPGRGAGSGLQGLVDRLLTPCLDLSLIQVMPALRKRLSRYLTDSRLPEPAIHSVQDFYREEFIKCQRCLDKQREYYSEHAIRDVEQALVKVMSQLDRLCARGRCRRSRQSASATVRRRHGTLGVGRSPASALTFSASHLRHDLVTVLRSAIDAVNAGLLVRRTLDDR